MAESRASRCRYCQGEFPEDRLRVHGGFCCREHAENARARQRADGRQETDGEGAASGTTRKPGAGDGGCPWCGEPLPLLVRLKGGRFCSAEHEEAYLRREAESFLERVKRYRRQGGGSRLRSETAKIHIRPKKQARGAGQARDPLPTPKAQERWQETRGPDPGPGGGRQHGQRRSLPRVAGCASIPVSRAMGSFLRISRACWQEAGQREALHPPEGAVALLGRLSRSGVEFGEIRGYHSNHGVALMQDSARPEGWRPAAGGAAHSVNFAGSAPFRAADGVLPRARYRLAGVAGAIPIECSEGEAPAMWRQPALPAGFLFPALRIRVAALRWSLAAFSSGKPKAVRPGLGSEPGGAWADFGVWRLVEGGLESGPIQTRIPRSASETASSLRVRVAGGVGAATQEGRTGAEDDRPSGPALHAAWLLSEAEPALPGPSGPTGEERLMPSRPRFPRTAAARAKTGRVSGPVLSGSGADPGAAAPSGWPAAAWGGGLPMPQIAWLCGEGGWRPVRIDKFCRILAEKAVLPASFVNRHWEGGPWCEAEEAPRGVPRMSKPKAGSESPRRFGAAMPAGTNRYRGPDSVLRPSTDAEWGWVEPGGWSPVVLEASPPIPELWRTAWFWPGSSYLPARPRDRVGAIGPMVEPVYRWSGPLVEPMAEAPQMTAGIRRGAGMIPLVGRPVAALTMPGAAAAWADHRRLAETGFPRVASPIMVIPPRPGGRKGRQPGRKGGEARGRDAAWAWSWGRTGGWNVVMPVPEIRGTSHGWKLGAAAVSLSGIQRHGAPAGGRYLDRLRLPRLVARFPECGDLVETGRGGAGALVFHFARQ